MDPALFAHLRQTLPPALFARLLNDPAALATLLASISLGAPRAATTQEDFERVTQVEIEEAKRCYEKQKRTPPYPAPALPRAMAIEGARRERQRTQDISGSKCTIYKTYCGIEKHFSCTNLSDLKPIFLKDMLVNSTHTGRYLLARIVSPPSASLPFPRTPVCSAKIID